MQTKLFFLKTITNLHCGIGQGLSDIDLPTAKESVSGHPYVPGSSIKGVLRDALAPGADADLLTAAFGAEGSECADAASSAVVTDARLLCLPVRSFFGTFAWVASPYTLNMFKTLINRASVPGAPELPAFNPDAVLHYRCATTTGSRIATKKLVMLEDLDLTVEEGSENIADAWSAFIAERVFEGDTRGTEFFKQRFVIVDDNVFNFLCETALPIQAHIRIDGKTGTVAKGQLWYMETVPPEAILTGLTLTDKGRGAKYARFDAASIMTFVTGASRFLQIGGNASTGCGLAVMRFSGAN